MISPTKDYRIEYWRPFGVDGNMRNIIHAENYNGKTVEKMIEEFPDRFENNVFVTHVTIFNIRSYDVVFEGEF